MPEQVLYSVVGSMGTALVGAIGVLGWMVKNRSNSHQSTDTPMKQTIELWGTLMERQIEATEKQTETLHGLSEATSIHNSESKGRHDILMIVLAQLQERERGG